MGYVFRARGEGRRAGWAAVAAAALVSSAAGAHAEAVESEGAFTHEIVYKADVMGPVSGGAAHAGRFLDNLDIKGDLDLDKAFGWGGAKAHGYILNNSGGAPNDVAGTLQGIDNIEVSRARLRLYELWLEQGFADGHATIRAGLYDLNSEFYSTEASGLLLAPPFGVGSELASTGPNGPSIFPSTTLAVRLHVESGPAYAQAAILNANASTIGDPNGVDTELDRGALVIAEAGMKGPTRLAAGAWRYTKRQDDIRDLAASGAAARRTAKGAYLLAEHSFTGEDTHGSTVRGFARIGVADGDTSPFRGGFQTGVLVEKVFASRPDSALSIGFERGFLSDKQRANSLDAGFDPSHAESSVEITYSDSLTSRITIQPDVQFFRYPGGDRDARNVVVAGLRLTFHLD
jgi:porin